MGLSIGVCDPVHRHCLVSDALELICPQELSWSDSHTCFCYAMPTQQCFTVALIHINKYDGVVEIDSAKNIRVCVCQT